MQNLKKQKDKVAIKLLRRKVKVNAQIKATSPDFRVLVTKSNLYIKAQVIAQWGNIIAHITDKTMKGATKVQRAELAGKALAELMKKQSIAKAAFDRNGNRYHGRVKAFADGLRAGGIQI